MGSGVIVLDIDGVIKKPTKGGTPDYDGQQRICTYVQQGHSGKSHRFILNTGRGRNYTEAAAGEIGDPEAAVIEEGGFLYLIHKNQVILNPTVNAVRNRPSIQRIKELLPDRVSYYPGKEICITVIPHEGTTVPQLYGIACHALQSLPVTITYSIEAVNIMPEGTDKGTGLLYLIELWPDLGHEEAIDLSQSLGIGDSQNDFPFFKVIVKEGGKIGCPSNATEQCKDFIRSHGGYIATQTFASGAADIIDVFFNKEPQQEVLILLATNS